MKEQQVLYSRFYKAQDRFTTLKQAHGHEPFVIRD